MADPKKGFWLLPTRRRLDKLTAFLESAQAMGQSTWITIIVQGEELAELLPEYEKLPKRFPLVRVVASRSEGMAAKCQEVWQREHDCGQHNDWIGILADDLICRTPNWDLELISPLNGWNFTSCDDGWQAPNRVGGGGIALSGDLVRALGYLAPPGLTHLYWDDVLETLGRDMGIWHPQMHVLLEHKHAALEAKPIDSTTRLLGTYWAADEKAYRIWRRTDREAAGKRIADLMKSKGVKMIDTDLTGVRLLVTTPSPDPFFDAGFMDSLLALKLMVEKLGGEFDFHKLPGCSDIVYGRATLFTGFVNSDFTHNLMIDSDMTFAPMDVVRMLKLNEPFIAIAGPRKGDGEMVFAATNADDRGVTHPAAVYQTEQGIIAEVTEVGGAFVMVDRQFANRMTEAYGDLQFQSADGRSHWGLWLPTINDLRYRGEDYAMCKRWREIGGKVKVLATAALGHTGTKTWQGAFIQQIQRTHAEQAQKEAAQ